MMSRHLQQIQYRRTGIAAGAQPLSFSVGLYGRFGFSAKPVERTKFHGSLQTKFDAVTKDLLDRAVPASRNRAISGSQMGSDWMAPRKGIIGNHRHDEPLFVLSMVA